jgi:hypothetical protein
MFYSTRHFSATCSRAAWSLAWVAEESSHLEQSSPQAAQRIIMVSPPGETKNWLLLTKGQFDYRTIVQHFQSYR